MDNNKIIKWYDRLNLLKQETILRYLEYINLDNDMDIYDYMIKGIVKGDLIDVYSSDVLDDLNDEEVLNIKKDFQENANLCFYDGNIDYWLDSIEGVSLQDLDLSVVKVFDNFDYLMKLIKDDKDSIIPLLKSFKKSDIFQGNSVIDTLRNTFYDDEALEICLKEVSKEESFYKDLKDEEKAVLFTYPNHVLYERVDDKVYVTDPFLLKKKIVNYLGDEDLENIPDLVSLVDLIGEEVFYNTISNMYLDSLQEEGLKRR